MAAGAETTIYSFVLKGLVPAGTSQTRSRWCKGPGPSCCWLSCGTHSEAHMGTLSLEVLGHGEDTQVQVNDSRLDTGVETSF